MFDPYEFDDYYEPTDDPECELDLLYSADLEREEWFDTPALARAASGEGPLWSVLVDQWGELHGKPVRVQRR